MMKQIVGQLEVSHDNSQLIIPLPKRHSHNVTTDPLDFKSMKKQKSESNEALKDHLEESKKLKDESCSILSKSTCADSDTASEKFKLIPEFDRVLAKFSEYPEFDLMNFARLICNPRQNLLENSLMDKQDGVIKALKLTNTVNASYDT